jgi:hypothetical protein
VASRDSTVFTNRKRGILMTNEIWRRRLNSLFAAAAVVLLSASGAGRVHAEDRGSDDDGGRVRRGLEIAPVPLNLEGKDVRLVGLGSYLVNAVASCNDCHAANPMVEYEMAGTPFFKGNPPRIVNPLVYLGGGRNFGQLTTPPAPMTPEIISRNITPDKTGRPAGRTFDEFVQIMRTGIDFDHLHPNCTTDTTDVASSTVCFASELPFNGDLLQIMPWPIFQSFQAQDLRAIYEYLKAIPCIAGPGPEAHEC